MDSVFGSPKINRQPLRVNNRRSVKSEFIYNNNLGFKSKANPSVVSWASEELTIPCNKLIPIPEDTTKLSDMLNIIVDNYAEYVICREKTSAWIEWYTAQKQNYQKKIIIIFYQNFF